MRETVRRSVCALPDTTCAGPPSHRGPTVRTWARACDTYEMRMTSMRVLPRSPCNAGAGLPRGHVCWSVFVLPVLTVRCDPQTAVRSANTYDRSRPMRHKPVPTRISMYKARMTAPTRANNHSAQYRLKLYMRPVTVWSPSDACESPLSPRGCGDSPFCMSLPFTTCKAYTISSCPYM